MLDNVIITIDDPTLTREEAEQVITSIAEELDPARITAELQTWKAETAGSEQPYFERYRQSR